VSDLFAPVTGEIIERNEEVIAAPELVNEDPYGEGWLVVIRPDDAAELDELLDPGAYEELVRSLAEEA
jgi:glycine cleavage system H protein